MSATATTSPAELSIPADRAAVRHASSWLDLEASAQGVPVDQIRRLDHCLDESLANILAHGGAGARESPILLRLTVRRNAGDCAAELTVVDSGVAFDARTVSARSRPATGSLSEAQPGGLGLVMMRRFSDDLEYLRGDGRNHLTFIVRWGDVA